MLYPQKRIAPEAIYDRWFSRKFEESFPLSTAPYLHLRDLLIRLCISAWNFSAKRLSLSYQYWWHACHTKIWNTNYIAIFYPVPGNLQKTAKFYHKKGLTSFFMRALFDGISKNWLFSVMCCEDEKASIYVRKLIGKKNLLVLMNMLPLNEKEVISLVWTKHICI